MPIRTDPSAPMPSSTVSAHTVGVEEELFLVDLATSLPTSCTETLVAGGGGFGRARLVEEMCDGVVELVSPICVSAGEAVATLAELRASLLGADGTTLLGVGVHPTLAFGDVRHRHSTHYDHVARDTRALLRQSTYCGVHVHVGMPDRETTIVAFNGMRKWIPLLQALSANSPFWHGRDSGLAGARTVLTHSVPRSGLPRAFADWADFAAYATELCRVAEVPDGSSLWWDMRPHHTLGTLEIRGVDAQSSLADLAAISALIHCLCCHEALVADTHDPAPEIVAENAFRAIRDGLDATLAFDGPHLPVRDLARHACDVAAGHADALGCVEELAGVERMLVEGNGAARQRRAFQAGGMEAVLRMLRDETAAPLDAPQGPLSAPPPATAAA